MGKKKLRVFEAFAGIGAQSIALSRLNIDYEIVGISEWFIDAISCYDILNCDQSQKIEIPSYEEQLEYLNNFTFSKDSVKPTDLNGTRKSIIERLYVTNKRTKNFGSILEINGSDLPPFDLLVYSFPCQDLSIGGNHEGMKKGSGTRSGLLWEIERILIELTNEYNFNVLIGKKFKIQIFPQA